MESRVMKWARVGFIVACAWVFYSFVVPPGILVRSLNHPAVQVGFITCPILFFFRDLPLRFWWVPLINAATYGFVGFSLELLIRKQNPPLAPEEPKRFVAHT